MLPNVITDEGKDGYELETIYEETENANMKSTEPEKLAKALHGSVIPVINYGFIITKLKALKKINTVK